MFFKNVCLVIIRRIHIILFILILLWISQTFYQFSSKVENEKDELDQKLSDLNVKILELLNVKDVMQKELLKLGEMINFKNGELKRFEMKKEFSEQINQTKVISTSLKYFVVKMLFHFYY